MVVNWGRQGERAEKQMEFFFARAEKKTIVILSHSREQISRCVAASEISYKKRKQLAGDDISVPTLSRPLLLGAAKKIVLQSMMLREGR